MLHASAKGWMILIKILYIIHIYNTIIKDKSEHALVLKKGFKLGQVGSRKRHL